MPEEIMVLENLAFDTELCNFVSEVEIEGEAFDTTLFTLLF